MRIQANLYETNKLFLKKHNFAILLTKWLFLTNIFIGFLSLLSIFIFILEFGFNGFNLKVYKDLEEGFDVFLYNYDIFSYYIVSGIAIIFFTFSIIGNLIIFIINFSVFKMRNTNQKKKFLRFQSLIILVINFMILLWFLLDHKSLMLNLPRNDVPTIVDRTSYYYNYISNLYINYEKPNWNSPVIINFLVVFIFLIGELIFTTIYFWFKMRLDINIIQINSNKYLNFRNK